MRIVRLESHGFGRLVNLAIAFEPGLNVVLGLNEAGKSTLVDAILAGLYGLRGRSGFLRELRDLKAPWCAGAPYAVALTMTDQRGQELLVHRNFREGEVQVWRRTAAGILPADEAAIGSVLGSMGTASLSLFTSTFLVRQTEVAALDRKSLGQALVEKLTDGESEVSAREAIRSLDRRREELVRGGDRQPGLLAQAGERLRRYQEIRERTRHKADQYHEARAETRSLQDRREAALAECEGLRPMIDGYLQLDAADGELERKGEELRRAVSRREEGEGLCRRLGEVEAELAEMIAAPRYDSWRERTGDTLEGLEQAVDGLTRQCQAARQAELRKQEELRELIAQLETAGDEVRRLDPSGLGRAGWERLEELAREREEHLEKAGERQAQADSLAPRARLSQWCFGGLLIALAATAGLLTAWLREWTPGLWAAAVTAVLCGLLLGAYLRTMGEIRHRDLLASEAAQLRRKAGELERRLVVVTGDGTAEQVRERVRQLASLEGRLAQFERSREAIGLAMEMSGREALEAAAGNRQRQLGELLAELGVEGLEAARSLLEGYRRLLDSRKLLRAELAGHLSSERMEDLRSRTDHLAAEVAALQARRDLIARDLRITLKPHEFLQYKDRLDYLERELAQGEADLTRLDERTKVLEADLAEGDPWQLAAHIDAETQLIARLEREALALGLAKKCLEEATEEAQRMVAPALQERAGELLAGFSGGRYHTVAIEVEDGELQVQVRSPDTGGPVPDRALSAGARDQLYLALRVALAEHLAGTSSFPLILDDPTTHYDPERLAATASAIVELARRHQIIWVTRDLSLPERLPSANLMYLKEGAIRAWP